MCSPESKKRIPLVESHGFILCQNSIRIPRKFKPTNTSQEPGVKGVTKANKPTTIKKMPIIFLIINLRRRFFFRYQRGVNIQKSKQQTHNYRPHEKADWSEKRNTAQNG